MNTLPQRSPGVLLSPLGDRAVAYDLVTETVHHLNASAGMMLAACDGATDIDKAVAGWAGATGANVDTVASDVTTGLKVLADLGLVGRTDPFEVPEPPSGCTTAAAAGSVCGKSYPVIDWALTLRSTQPDLLAKIDAFLGANITCDPTRCSRR